jgi:hypothetical protein
MDVIGRMVDILIDRNLSFPNAIARNISICAAWDWNEDAGRSAQFVIFRRAV